MRFRTPPVCAVYDSYLICLASRCKYSVSYRPSVAVRGVTAVPLSKCVMVVDRVVGLLLYIGRVPTYLHMSY